jgi:hypothetical protein
MGTYKEPNEFDDLSDEDGEDDLLDECKIKENDPDIQN